MRTELGAGHTARPAFLAGLRFGGLAGLDEVLAGVLDDLIDLGGLGLEFLSFRDAIFEGFAGLLEEAGGEEHAAP